MQYKQNTKIIIDKRKLDILIRIGCPDDVLLNLIKTGSFEKTGDDLIDETLECLLDVKEFDNWGGCRKNAGRKRKKNKVKEIKINHLENQDENQVVDKDIDIDKDIYINNNIIFNKKKLLSFGEFGNVLLTKEDFEKIKEKKPDLYEKAIEKLDGWLDSRNGEKNKGRNHRSYFKSNSWVWDGLTPKAYWEDL